MGVVAASTGLPLAPCAPCPRPVAPSLPLRKTRLRLPLILLIGVAALVGVRRRWRKRGDSPPVLPAPPVNGPAWFGYGRDAQHTAVSAIATQDLGRVAWSTPVDLRRSTAAALLIHYGSPLVTRQHGRRPGEDRRDRRLPVEGRAARPAPCLDAADRLPCRRTTGRRASRRARRRGQRSMRRAPAARAASRDDAEPPARVARARRSTAPPRTTRQPAAYDANVFINTPLTVDAQGNVFFGFQVTGANPAGLESGIARVDADGTGTWVSAATAAGDAGDRRRWRTNSAPALSADGSTLYVAVSNARRLAAPARLPARARQHHARARAPRSRSIDPNGRRPTRVQRRRHGVADGRPRRRRLLRRAREAVPARTTRAAGCCTSTRPARRPATPGAFGWDDTAVDRAGVDGAVVRRHVDVPADDQVQQLRRRRRRRREPARRSSIRTRPGRPDLGPAR